MQLFCSAGFSVTLPQTKPVHDTEIIRRVIIMGQSRSLALLVPALAAPINVPESSPAETVSLLPSLQTLLARASVSKLAISGMEAQLLHLFNVDLAGNDPPVAALTHTLDCGECLPGWRMRCDPVHLVPGHNSLTLAASGDELDISPEESGAIIGELNRFYKKKGWCFEAPHPARWYLSLPQPPQLQTSPLPEVMGHSIDRYLPRGKDAAEWKALLSEVQMLLHGNKINLQRESCGKPVINSLWFWGGGALPVIGKSSWSRVWSDDLVGRALAGIASTSCSPVPETACQWLKEAAGGKHLLVLDRGRYIPRFEERYTWLELLLQLDERWFSPLLVALKRGELDRLDIYTGSNQLFSLTRRSLWRYWRSCDDIVTLLERDG